MAENNEEGQSVLRALQSLPLLPGTMIIHYCGVSNA